MARKNPTTTQTIKQQKSLPPLEYADIERVLAKANEIGLLESCAIHLAHDYPTQEQMIGLCLREILQRKR